MRRCITNAPAMCLGLACELDVSGATVTKWEIHLRAAMIASARRFTHDMRARVAQLHESMSQSSAASLSVHCVRGGATNTHVWQTSKLHTLEVGVGYTSVPIFPFDSFQWVIRNVLFRRDPGDLQVAGGSRTLDTLAMVRKQITSSGAASWNERVIDLHPSPVPPLADASAAAAPLMDASAENPPAASTASSLASL
eukprot:369321-Pyramimonas_sp.AAC.1